MYRKENKDTRKDTLRATLRNFDIVKNNKETFITKNLYTSLYNR